MKGYIDIPSRALLYLRLHHPSAPDDPDRYASLTVRIQREPPLHDIVMNGWWKVEIAAGWKDRDGDVYVSVDVPLKRLLTEEYAVVTEFTEPLW